MRKKIKGIIGVVILYLFLFTFGLYGESIKWKLSSADYQIIKDEDGFDVIDMAGFSSGGSPGDPQLPQKIFNFALPPDVDISSITLDLSDEETKLLEGSYNIKPAPPACTWVGGKFIVEWGKDKNIVDGKNMKVYGIDTFFPACPVEILSPSQMRKWKFISIVFIPFQYNPVSGQLLLTKSVEISISFNRIETSKIGISSQQFLNALSDRVMDDVAKDMFVNFNEANLWYEETQKQVQEGIKEALPSQTTYDYVIITTNNIKNNSTKLNDFVHHKEYYIGHSVKVVTEDDYSGLTGQPPNGTAEKIRQWLKENYLSMGIKYVLLIGNPDPISGDIPMKMCWPNRGAGSDEESPTDYFYADLTGNWDKDGDGYFGEYPDDSGTGGVDFAPEVYVGRIPVYGSDYTSLDSILQKIMDYEMGAGDISWRKKMLLPMAISNYDNENNSGNKRTDGRDLPKKVIEDYLNSKGFSYFVLYEKAGLDPVPDTADYDNPSHTGISQTSVINEWLNTYGCVFWWGHGSETGAYRKYWSSDDGDNVPESAEMSWPTFFTSASCPSLGNTKPSLVYQSSCDNGHPENNNNLGYALLKNGAIGTVSASRVSWYLPGTWEPVLSLADNAGIGYYFFKKIVENNKPFGEALYLAKNECGNVLGGPIWMNKMDFNLYGDPSLLLIFSVSPVLNVDPTSLDFGMEEETKTFNIRNTGGGALHWNIGDVDYKEGSGWITSISPLLGTTTETDVVTVNVSRTGLSGGTYTATIPVTSDGGNQDISVSIRKKSPPDTPTNISPANGATGVSLTPVLKASAFSDPDGDTMLLARWRIKKEGEVIWQSSNTATSISVPSGVLQYSTTYTWQARYVNTYNLESEWSYETSFTTRERPMTPPNKPVNISPSNLAKGVSLTPVLTASAFSDPDGDIMADSQWRIRGETGTYETMAVWENNSAGAVTSVLVSTPLQNNTTYFWQVRYKDSTGMWSSWSDETSFTTISSPDGGDSGGGGGGGGCFIATAAFGTPMAKEVVRLREFRDRYLLTNRPGRAFVRWYYRHSPKLAGYIRQSKWTRAFVRGVLRPLVWFLSVIMR